MRIVLDACIPARFGDWLPEFEVSTVRGVFGSSDFDDGPLLRALVGHCDCFVTVDRGIPHQQVISRLPFSLVLLRTRSNRLEHLVPLASVLREAVRTLGPGEMAVLGV